MQFDIRTPPPSNNTISRWRRATLGRYDALRVGERLLGIVYHSVLALLGLLLVAGAVLVTTGDNPLDNDRTLSLSLLAVTTVAATFVALLLVLQFMARGATEKARYAHNMLRPILPSDRFALDRLRELRLQFPLVDDYFRQIERMPRAPVTGEYLAAMQYVRETATHPSISP